MAPERKEALLAKMPVFVREEVAALRARVAELEEQLTARADKKSMVIVEGDGDLKKRPDGTWYREGQLPLGDDVTVRFYLDEQEWIDLRRITNARSKKKETILEVRGNSGLDITCESSNNFTLAPTWRR